MIEPPIIVLEEAKVLRSSEGRIPMNEEFVIIDGVVGSDALGFSVHHHGGGRQDCYLAAIGLREGSKLIWQEIEMTRDQASQFGSVLVGGNKVRVSGLLKKQLGRPVYRVQVDGVQLIKTEQTVALRTAA